MQSFKSMYLCKAPNYQHPPSQNIYLGPRNSPYLDHQLMLSEASPKSDSISMEHVEGSSGWKSQMNIYGNASPYYWQKTEQIIDGYQARLGALIGLFQPSKSSHQNMSLKRRQFKTKDRIICTHNLIYKKQTWRKQKYEECTTKCKPF